MAPDPKAEGEVPLDKIEERYTFYRLSDIDFDTASHTLRLLKRYRKLQIRFVIIRDAIISYARPFSGSRGRSGSFYKFPLELLPERHVALHEELMTFRNKAIAHSDIDFVNPTVANWSSDKGKWFPMSLRNFHNETKALATKWKTILEMVTKIRVNLRTECEAIEDKYFLDKRQV